MRHVALVFVAVLVATSSARAQAAADDHAWSFYASAYAYLVPGNEDYVQPTFTADRDGLHLEARRNYEAKGAGSIWIGYNFDFGDAVTFEGTAMIGGVFGEANGVAPGFKATLSWSKLKFYSEAEYLFDSNESSDSFFYAWSELSWQLSKACRVGLAGQRTKAYQTDRDVQRGLLIGFSSERVDFSAYGFNLDERSPTFVAALGVSF